MDKINIILVIRSHCKSCYSIMQKLKLLQNDGESIDIKIYHINDAKKNDTMFLKHKVLITPALFVDGRLKLYGDESMAKLKSLILN